MNRLDNPEGVLKLIEEKLPSPSRDVPTDIFSATIYEQEEEQDPVKSSKRKYIYAAILIITSFLLLYYRTDLQAALDPLPKPYMQTVDGDNFVVSTIRTPIDTSNYSTIRKIGYAIKSFFFGEEYTETISRNLSQIPNKPKLNVRFANAFASTSRK